jgi:hypothetical protein
MANIDDVFREVVYNVGQPLANQLHDLEDSDRSRATSRITGSKQHQEGMERAEKVPWTSAPEPLSSKCAFEGRVLT